jgi:hypothetical protein
MTIRSTLTAACVAPAFMAAGAVLAPNSQAETLLPPADRLGPNGIDEVPGVPAAHAREVGLYLRLCAFG